MRDPNRQRVRTPLRDAQPVFYQRFAEQTVDVDDVVKVRRTDGEMLRGDFVGAAREHLELRNGDCRAAPSADFAVAPRLLRDPLDRVEPIVLIVMERQILTFGSKTAATILRHDYVATFDSFGANGSTAFFVIGRANQDHWKTLRSFRLVN